MKQSNVKIFLFLYLFSWSYTYAQNENKKLKIEILYEALCPDSVRFMGHQLGTFYEDLKDFIDIEFVPFGKAHSENNGADFYCQHGPNECEGNRQQSCALQQTDDQETQVKFVVCQMSRPLRPSIDYCAQSSGLSKQNHHFNESFNQCMQTDLGTRLQLHAEQITNKYKPRFIPTIVFENQFDQGLQHLSLNKFNRAVCSQLVKRGYVTAGALDSPCALRYS